MFVLGVDPGLSRCGYCVVEAAGRTNSAVALGVIRTRVETPVPDRLVEVSRDISGIIEEFSPSAVAIERVLFKVNVSTAIGVAQAAGVIMAQAAARGLVVQEYSPNEVKRTVAGDGRADKLAVQQMVQRLLRLPRPPKPADAADAAAVALTHLAMHPPGRSRTTLENRTTLEKEKVR